MVVGWGEGWLELGVRMGEENWAQQSATRGAEATPATTKNAITGEDPWPVLLSRQSPALRFRQVSRGHLATTAERIATR